MAEARLSFVIEAKDRASGAFDALKGKATEVMSTIQSKTTQVTDKIKGAFSAFTQHWKGVSASIYAASKAIGTAWNMAEVAAQVKEQKAYINALATEYSTNADRIIADITRVSRGMISLSDAATVAGSSLARGLRPEQLTELASAAETLAKGTGQRVGDLFKQLAEAISTGEAESLKATLGVLDLKAAYGSLTDQMSTAERSQARYAMAMEKVRAIQEKLGPTTDSVHDKMTRFKVGWENLRTAIGGGLVSAFLVLRAVITQLAIPFLPLAAGVMKVIQAFQWMKGDLEDAEKWGDAASEMLLKVAEMAESSQSDIKAAFSSSEEGSNSAAAAMKRYAAAVQEAEQNENARQTAMREAASQMRSVVTAWSSYYSSLKSAHAQALSEMEAKTREFHQLEQTIMEQRWGYVDLQHRLQQTLMGEEEKYQDQMSLLQAKYDAAMALSGEERIKALTAWQQARAAMINEVKAGDTVVVTQEEAVKAALEDVARAQAIIAQDQDELTAKRKTELEFAEAWAVALEEAMAMAKEGVDYYKEALAQVDAALKDQRVLSVDVSGAVSTIRDLEAAMERFDARGKLALDFSQVGPSINQVSVQIDALGTKRVTIQGDPNPAIRATDQVQEALRRIPTEKVVKIKVELQKGAGVDSALLQEIDKGLAQAARYGRSALAKVVAP